MIARPDSGQERIFTPIELNVYIQNFDPSELNADQQTAQNLLALAHKEFAYWEHLWGWKLDVKGQFGRLLLQHRLAIEAELAAQWQRADFFWHQVQIELKLLCKKQQIWQDLALAVTCKSEVTIMSNPSQLRQRLVDELFIDTHCAFYNGLMPQLTKPSLSERAFIHIDYIQQLLEWSAMSGEEVQSLLGVPWQTRITLCQQAKKWQQAIYFCKQRLKYLPHAIDFQNDLAENYYLGTLEKIREPKSEAQHSQNAKRLQAGIHALEKCLENYPYNLSIFELLGALYNLHAISLSNSNYFVEALVSIQTAVTYNPYSEKAFDTRNELVQIMTELQDQIGQVQNVQLNQKGQHLLAQAKKGFKPMNAYSESKAAKKTASASQVAQAANLWQRIGLPQEGWQESAADGKTRSTQATASWIKQAFELWDAVVDVLNQPPQTKAELTTAWQTAIAQKPNLSGLNSAMICEFLERKLFGEASDRVLVTPPPPSREQPPILTPISIKCRSGSEPLLFWLFSRQDLRIKVQAVIATVLVLVAGGLIMQDKARSTARDKAYQQILTAQEIQNDLSVVQAAEQFFANVPFRGNDGRNQQVMEFYTKSLVRWFAQQSDKPDTSIQVHLDRYRQVRNTVKANELEGNQP